MEETPTHQDPIQAFVERLLEEKNLGTLDPEVMEQVRGELEMRVEDRINAVILSHIPEEKLEEFETIVDTGDEEKIQSFCQEHIPSLDVILGDELKVFRETYLSV